MKHDHDIVVSLLRAIIIALSFRDTTIHMPIGNQQETMPLDISLNEYMCTKN